MHKTAVLMFALALLLGAPLAMGAAAAEQQNFQHKSLDLAHPPPADTQPFPDVMLPAEALCGCILVRCCARATHKRGHTDLSGQPSLRQLADDQAVGGRLVKTGWDAGIRTPIPRSRAACPTIERRPSRREKPNKWRLLGSMGGPVAHPGEWRAGARAVPILVA